MALKELYARFAQFPNLELRDKTQPTVQLWAGVEEDSLRGAYFRLLKQSGDPHAQLAAELSQRLLLGLEVQLS